MQFIEMTGRTLFKIVRREEITPDNLQAAGVHGDSVLRINPQGDIELRMRAGWEIIGGLIGDFVARVQHETGLDFA